LDQDLGGPGGASAGGGERFGRGRRIDALEIAAHYNLVMASSIVESACPLDCPDACSLEVHVEEGRVAAVGGSRTHPLTDGYICAKVRRMPEHLYGPHRMLHPGIRAGNRGEGTFRRASWDEALDRIATRMRALTAAGRGEAILPFFYGGSNGYLSQGSTDARLFSRLGASRLARTVCAAPSSAAAAGLYGKMPGVALSDYAHAKLIVLWGVNPSASGIHLIPPIYAARERGARLVVVDPRRTPLAARADLHLAVRPGTDLAVALSIIRELFETGRADAPFLASHTTGAQELRRRASVWTPEKAAAVAGIDAGDIRRFAGLYADSSPAAIRCGWGVERNRNGGSAVAAILALPAVAGKFGVRGGGYTMSNSAAWDLSAEAGAGADPWKTREINMNRLGAVLLERDRPVDLLFVYNANPLATIPDQGKVRAGLLREDLFTVVFDPVMTDTARYADVVLPAATFLERPELSRGYGAYVLHRTAAAAEPAGEARPNHEVFAELCRRTGVAREGDADGAEELMDRIVASSARADSIARSLRADRQAVAPCGASPVQFVDVFPRTPDGRVHLVAESLDREAPAGLYGFRPETDGAGLPLALISPASDRTISSTFGELWPGPASARLHPQDAGARGIAPGDRIRLWNPRGEVVCLASLDPSVRPGVVVLAKGLWSHHTFNGSTATALASDAFTDLGGGACFNDARVEVERIEAR
jgi:anaerobic selenocysteine-containing dehydrogenase